jgi:hypothetical protein
MLTTKERQLANETCDACGRSSDGRGISAALVRVVYEKGFINLCAHHFSTNEHLLRTRTFVGILDERPGGPS